MLPLERYVSDCHDFQVLCGEREVELSTVYKVMILVPCHGFWDGKAGGYSGCTEQSDDAD